MSTRKIEQPCAVVIGLDFITGLQTARILAGHRVPVIGVAKNPKHFCCRTRVCTQILFADTASCELINTLVTLGPKLLQKAVLFPCTDMSVLLISRHREKLERCYHVVLPEPKVVEMLINKLSFYTYAQEKGLPVPRMFFLYNRADAEQAVEKLTFPCVLKPPIKTPNWEKHTKAKVFKVFSVEEFLSLYDRCSTWTEVLIVQEWIEGGDESLYTCNCYFSADSKPVATFVSRKLRQWPAEIGQGCLAEECSNDIVLYETIKLFQSVGYRGLGYLEMKRDARTGKYFITEPNIGRPTGRSAMAEAGGVDLLYAKYCDTVGLPLPPNLEQKYGGIKWIDFTRDFQSALHYWRRGDLTLKELLRSWRGRKTYAVFSWTDPAPFWWDLLEYLSKNYGPRKL